MRKSIQTGKYKHYKGKEYEVLGVAQHSESLEPFVIYKALYESEDFGPNALWARPYDMFVEKIMKDGKEIARFEYIGE
jgi:cyclomaltodextrinase / maltogenic alpha-amylase / neopullulanase